MCPATNQLCTCHVRRFRFPSAVPILATDAGGDQSFTLDAPLLGLHVPAMTWARLLFDEADNVVLVLASAEYDDADYIRDRDEFDRIIAAGRTA